MDHFIKVSGIMIKDMEKVKNFFLMVLDMKANIKMERKMEEEK